MSHAAASRYPKRNRTSGPGAPGADAKPDMQMLSVQPRKAARNHRYGLRSSQPKNDKHKTPALPASSHRQIPLELVASILKRVAYPDGIKGITCESCKTQHPIELRGVFGRLFKLSRVCKWWKAAVDMMIVDLGCNINFMVRSMRETRELCQTANAIWWNSYLNEGKEQADAASALEDALYSRLIRSRFIRE